MTENLTDAKPWEATASYVGSRVAQLQRGYVKVPREERAQRTLAELRRADPESPGADPVLWEILLDGLPDSLRGARDVPSPGEAAAFAALALYANHQQSRTEPMHRQGAALGQSVRDLAIARSKDGQPDSGVVTRFHSLVRAQSRAARLYNLRGLVGLLRGSSIPVDYGLLAADLWLLETRAADGVRLRWGRQFHSYKTNVKSESNEGEN